MDIGKTTVPVASPPRLAGFGRGPTAADKRTVLGLPGSMNTLAGTHPLKAAGLTGCLGGCVAALGFWQTGLIATVPAATGLTALAASDLATHRFSLKTLRLATALVVAGLVIDATHASAWDRLVATVAVTGLLAFALLALWFITPGIALGDVLMLTFAVLVPAWLSPWAAGTTILVAVVTGGAVAVVQRHGRPVGRPPATVAFGPALLAGWVVAVVIG